jgi:hypothetical protein
MDRVAASVGMLNGAAIEFERVQDVPDGGVLLVLPALLLLGLLSKSRENFSMSEGFYPLESIFLVLALMALGRIPSLEALRYEAPGEWGKLIGLDRIPEVRTLRQKVTELCAEPGNAQRWSSALAKQWMAEQPESAGVFYADGHVRVYHGKLTDLPRRYVARERLCLRGTTDYWSFHNLGDIFLFKMKAMLYILWYAPGWEDVTAQYIGGDALSCYRSVSSGQRCRGDREAAGCTLGQCITLAYKMATRWTAGS